MDLFMVSLGGKVEGANIEVHDIQFVITDHIDNAIEGLKANWYGIEKKLHMDSYKRIKGADGYEIQLSREKDRGDKWLYFIHLGGYNQQSTQEIHDVAFFVAKSAQEAKERGIEVAEQMEIQGHVDQVVDVSECLLQVHEEVYYIHLKKSGKAFDMKPDWFGYRRLDLE